MEEVKALARFYKALADETRLRLIQLLAQQTNGQARCVGSLAKALNTTTANVSQHLKVLKTMSLVRSSRRGYQIHYYLDRGRMAEFDRLRTALLSEPLTEHINIKELEETTMCCNDKEKKDCQHPEMKQKSEDCTPEQIEKCHGEDAEHHCCEGEKS